MWTLLFARPTQYATRPAQFPPGEKHVSRRSCGWTVLILFTVNCRVTVLEIWDTANMAAPMPNPTINPTKSRTRAKIVGPTFGDTGVET
jgi:hypothetical protein